MSTQPGPPFGPLLRRARRTAGLTQEALAERAGISVGAVSALERGLTRAPQRDTLELLAEALYLPAEERAQWEQATRRLRLPSVDAAPLLDSAGRRGLGGCLRGRTGPLAGAGHRRGAGNGLKRLLISCRLKRTRRGIQT